MHRRRLARAALPALLALLAAQSIAVGRPAAAIQAPVSFTATALPTWQTDGVVWSAASAGGLVFVGGRFGGIRPPGAADNVDEVPRANFAVFDAATGLPSDCAPAFVHSASSTMGTVRALSVSPDGTTLYAGGYFTTVDGKPRANLAALDIATCTVLESFKPNPNSTVHTVRATADAVYYGGTFLTAGGQTRRRAAASTPATALLPGLLLPWAPNVDRDVLALAVSPDGQNVVLGGRFDTVNGNASHALAVVDEWDGASVHSYPDNFVPAGSVVKDLAEDATGFYTAHEGTGPGTFDGRIAVDWSSLGQRWRDTCLGATQAVAVWNGVVYSGSHAHDCATMGEYPDGWRYHLLAQSTTDPRKLGWFPNTNDGIGEHIGPRELVVAPGTGTGNDYLWAGGEFTTVNGVNQQGLTRFGQNDHSSAPSVPTHSLTSVKAGEVRVAWRQSLDLDDAGLIYRVYRDGSTTPISTQNGTSFFWSRRQLTFVDTGLLPGSTHSYRVTVSDRVNTVTTAWTDITVASAPSVYAQRVVADGAAFYWRYDEPAAPFFSDTSPNNTNGTLSGMAAYRQPGAIAGDPSRSLTLQGTTTTLFAEKRNPAPTVYSLETWFKTSTTAGGKLIGFGDKLSFESTNADRQVYMTDAGKLVFGVGLATTTTLTTPRAYNDGAWHHVAATQGPAGMALYVDGEKVGGNAVSAAPGYSGNWRVAGDTIGTQWPDRPTSRYFRGTLDETATYPTALTAPTVLDHYRLGRGGSLDVTPPSQVTGVTGTPAGNAVDLAWAAATDDVGVSGYDVHRAPLAATPASDANRVGTTTELTYRDLAVPDGEWFYRVVARDASGNRGPASAPVAVTVRAPVTVNVPILEDTYANQSVPAGTNHTSPSMLSRRSPGAVPYLKFQVPAAPAGRTLTAASLRLRTNTDTSIAGSVDAQEIRRVTAAWTAPTLTWNTRPAVDAAVLGTLPGGTVPNTEYRVTLDAAALADVPGTDASFAIVAGGNDSLWLWAAEHASPGVRPVLTLTYG